MSTTVLIVEDNDIIRRVAALNVERFGASYEFAYNGLEAVEKFATSNYALVLMDVAMPEMCGLQATRQIRALEKSDRRTPIVAITASAKKEECLAAGMDDYVAKPPDYERVLRRWMPELFKNEKFA